MCPSCLAVQICFFRLSGIRLIDFDALVAQLHLIWRTNGHRRLLGRERQPVEVSSGVCRVVASLPNLLSDLYVSGFHRVVVGYFITLCAYSNALIMRC